MCGICCGLTISERLGTKFIANGRYAYLMASVSQNLKAFIFSIANSLLETTSVINSRTAGNIVPQLSLPFSFAVNTMLVLSIIACICLKRIFLELMSWGQNLTRVRWLSYINLSYQHCKNQDHPFGLVLRTTYVGIGSLLKETGVMKLMSG